MKSSNTGSGNPTKVSIGGSGCPNCTNMNGHDNAPHQIAGFNRGIPGGTGKPGGTSPVAVNMGPPPVQAQRIPPPGKESPASSPPTMTYRPQPQYTADAKAAHIEGAVSLSIRVSATGAVQVLGVTRSLGHGLDEQAIRTMEGARFTPAHDASGRPVEWTGVVKVNFLLAS
jgi:TonB family protein